MSNRKLLLLGIVLITVEIGIVADFSLIGSAAASDIPFVFGEGPSNAASYTSAQIEQASIASPDLTGVPAISTPPDSATLDFPVVGGGSTPQGTTEKKVADLKKLFDSRVEPENSKVHEKALVLVAKYPGDRTIDQISSIYEYLKDGWHYVGDPRGVNNFFWANETLNVGEEANCVGVGDCGDFAILMSALIESIGGTTRIILASNNTTGGHAYAEVYLGLLNDPNSQVNNNIDWLKQKFDTDKIYTHLDTDTRDVWLNLDWSADHPGGSFYPGDKHIVLSIRDTYQKTPLKIPTSYQDVPASSVSSEQEPVLPSGNEPAESEGASVGTPGRMQGIVGTWSWFNGVTVTINSDRTVSETTGTWELTDAQKQSYTLNWNNGRYIDKLNLSADCNSLAGYNQDGTYVTGHKILCTGGSCGLQGIVGTWSWFSVVVPVTINSDRTISEPGNTGTWELTDAQKQSYTLNWNNGQYIDKLNLSADCNSLAGYNQDGTYVTGQRK